MKKCKEERIIVENEDHCGKSIKNCIWDVSVVIFVDFLQFQSTITTDYCGKLIVEKVKHANRSKESVILLNNNARSAAVTTNYLLTKSHSEVVEHPPYSPDLVPFDY